MNSNENPTSVAWMIRQQAVSEAAEPAIKRLTDAAEGDVKEIAASQIELLSKFYDLSLSQATRSFRWALVASVVGLVFFLAAIAFMLSQDSNAAIVSAVGGVMVQFIAGVNFVLYGKTLNQLTLFQGRLENTQRFLLANSLCESLSGRIKEYTRARLIGAISGIVDGDLSRDLVAASESNEVQLPAAVVQPSTLTTPQVVLDPAVDPTMNDTIPVVVPTNTQPSGNPASVTAAIAGRV